MGAIGIVPPPILVGGKSERALDVAVRSADGWHAPSMDPVEFAAIARELDRSCEKAGRSPLKKGIQLRTGDARHLRELVEESREAGASTLVFVLDTERGPDCVRRLADEVL